MEQKNAEPTLLRLPLKIYWYIPKATQNGATKASNTTSKTKTLSLINTRNVS